MEYDAHDSIRWVAPIHTHTERSVDWFWALGAVTIVGIGICIWLGNLLLALIIAVAALCVVLIASREPRDHEITLMRHGVIVERELYPYDSIHSFWIHEDHPVHPKLHISTKSWLHPHISLIIEEPAEPADVRTYLSDHLPEEEGHSLATYAAQVLGF